MRSGSRRDDVVLPWCCAALADASSVGERERESERERKRRRREEGGR